MVAIYPNIEGTIELYMKVLRAICGDTEGKSMVDLMCCFAPNTPKLGFTHRIYVDIIPRILDHSAEQHNFQLMDVLTIMRLPFKKDVTICSDGIEHLLPEDGYRLLKTMDRISHKQIIFTPLGEIFPLAKDNNHDPEAHRSLWTPEILSELDYATIVFPHYHKVWNGGAFFAWKCVDIEKDFQRVIKEINL